MKKFLFLTLVFSVLVSCTINPTSGASDDTTSLPPIPGVVVSPEDQAAFLKAFEGVFSPTVGATVALGDGYSLNFTEYTMMVTRTNLNGKLVFSVQNPEEKGNSATQVYVKADSLKITSSTTANITVAVSFQGNSKLFDRTVEIEIVNGVFFINKIAVATKTDSDVIDVTKVAKIPAFTLSNAVVNRMSETSTDSIAKTKAIKLDVSTTSSGYITVLIENKQKPELSQVYYAKVVKEEGFANIYHLVPNSPVYSGRYYVELYLKSDYSPNIKDISNITTVMLYDTEYNYQFVYIDFYNFPKNQFPKDWDFQGFWNSKTIQPGGTIEGY